MLHAHGRKIKGVIIKRVGKTVDLGRRKPVYYQGTFRSFSKPVHNVNL